MTRRTDALSRSSCCERTDFYHLLLLLNEYRCAGVTSWFRSRPKATLQQLALKMATIYCSLMRALLNFLSLQVMGFLKGALKMKAVQKSLASLEGAFVPTFRCQFNASAVTFVWFVIVRFDRGTCSVQERVRSESKPGSTGWWEPRQPRGR